MLAKKLKELREKKGISQAELANILDVAQQTVASWEKEKSSPNYEILQNIADYFHVSTDFLLGHDSGLFELSDKAFVPVIGSVRCGVGGLAYEYIDEYITIDDAYRPDEMRGFRAEGDSMEPEIRSGDICLVHLQDEVPDGAIAVVVIDGEEGTMKRVHRQGAAIILQSENPKYAPRVFSGGELDRVHIVGRVVEVRRNML